MEQRGEQIAGSQLFRDFCAVCGEPIRVTAEKRGLPKNFCLDCMRTAVHKLAESVQQRAGVLPPAPPPVANDDEDEDLNYDFEAELPDVD